MKLYGYWQSSATWRVRLALSLKGLSYQYIPVNLLTGEQGEKDHLSRNPQALVPVLETERGDHLTQSMAIIHYLERRFPENPLLPDDPIVAAKADSIAIMIACEAQPFGNRRVLQYLKTEVGFDDEKIKEWMNRWPGSTLKAVDALATAALEEHGKPFFSGDTPGLPEIFIIPQLYAARRFGADIDQFTTLLALEARCEILPAFQQAHAFAQIDNPKRTS